MKKRGGVEAIALITIFEIAVVFILFFAWNQPINDAKESTLFDRIALSLDLPEFINALLSAPGEVLALYEPPNLPLEEFAITFDQQEITVKTRNQAVSPKRGMFPQDRSVSINTQELFDGTSFLVFHRAPNSINIQDDIEFFSPQVPCEKPKALQQITNPILIDPVYGYDGSSPNSFGPTKNNFKSSIINRQISYFITQRNPAQFITSRNVNSLDQNNLELGEESISLQQRKLLVSDINNPITYFVSISTGSYPGTEKNTLKAYINKNLPQNELVKANFLACTIINSLSQASGYAFPPIESVSIVPTDPTHLLPTDQKILLTTDTPGIFLEIGNIHSPLEENMLQQKYLKHVAGVIFKAIDKTTSTDLSLAEEVQGVT